MAPLSLRNTPKSERYANKGRQENADREDKDKYFEMLLIEFIFLKPKPVPEKK